MNVIIHCRWICQDVKWWILKKFNKIIDDLSIFSKIIWTIITETIFLDELSLIFFLKWNDLGTTKSTKKLNHKQYLNTLYMKLDFNKDLIWIDSIWNWTSIKTFRWHLIFEKLNAKWIRIENFNTSLSEVS